MLFAGAPGAQGPTPAHWPSLRSGRLRYAAHIRGPSLARLGPCAALAWARSGCGCRDKPGTARLLGRARCLAYRARRGPPLAGGGGPPPASLRRGLRPLGGSVPGSVVGSGLLAAPAPGCCAALRCPPLRLCGSAPAPPSARAGGTPRAALFPARLPPGGRAAAAGRACAPFYGFAAAARPGRGGFPLRRDLLTLFILLWIKTRDMITIVVQPFDERSFLC